MIATVIAVALLGCPEDCSKVLVSKPAPRIREQVIEQVKKDEVEVSTWIEWNGKKTPVTKESGFYSIVTSEPSE